MTKRFSRWLPPLLGLFFVGSALAQPTAEGVAGQAPELREEEVFARWLKSSPEVASWRGQIGAARFDVVSAGLWQNPELQITGVGLLAGTPPDGQAGIQAQLTQAVPMFGQVGKRVEAARAQLSVSEMTVQVQLWERAADLLAAMVERAFADARASMIKRNIGELDRLLGIIDARNRAGANSRYDVLRVQATQSTMRSALTQAYISRDQAESKLLALVADPTLQAAPVTRMALLSFRGPDNDDELVRQALQRRPDLELSRRSVRAAEANAARHRRDVVPTPSLFVAAYVTRGEFGAQLSGGVTLPLPILDRNQGDIGRALTEASSQTSLASALTTRIRVEVLGAARARRSAQIALDQFRQQTLPIASEVLKRAEVTYQAGSFPIVSLIDAYQTVWDARLQELELEHQKAVAEADLEKAAALIPLELPPQP
jgi:cobalt-zinc-cadmium efflux system outer membrane protein